MNKDPLQVSFDVTFPQSDEHDTIRQIQKTIYNASRTGMFNLLSLVVGIILSLAWGLLMGVVEFFLLWGVHPFTKVVTMLYTPVAKVAGVILVSVFGDICRLGRGSVTIYNQPNKEKVEFLNDATKDMYLAPASDPKHRGEGSGEHLI